MAAECEVDVPSGPCGVAAIGRCSTCGRAFCVSHQAAAANPGHVVVDRCVTCLAAKKQAALTHDRQFGRGYITSGDARAELLARGVPKVELHKVSRELERRRFGGSRTVETVHPMGTGWLIGTFRWEYTEFSFGARDVVAEHPTVLRDHQTRDERQIFLRVRKDPDRHGYLVESGRRVASSWELLAEAVRRLARR